MRGTCSLGVHISSIDHHSVFAYDLGNSSWIQLGTCGGLKESGKADTLSIIIFQALHILLGTNGGMCPALIMGLMRSRHDGSFCGMFGSNTLGR